MSSEPLTWSFSSRSGQHGADRADSLSRMILRRFLRHRLAVIAISLFLLLALSALLAPLSPYDPTVSAPTNVLQPPSLAHWFGTDELGRDVFTRILYGGRISLMVGLFSTLLTLAIGVLIGAVAGYYGGWLDNLLMRITDAFLSFPSIFILILAASLLRDQPVAGLRNSVLVVIVIIAALSWMWPARLVRSLFLSLRARDFVTAARAVGGADRRLILRHILPNCVGPIMVNGTLEMAYAILTESGLSYLGFGVMPPTPSWGNILSTAQTYVFRAPWLAIFPGLMIFLTVITINFIGDGLRDALDPFSIKGKEH
jgi:peptide/nickel transport system permease protein